MRWHVGFLLLIPLLIAAEPTLSQKPVPSLAFNAHLVDGSVLRVTLLDEALEFNTAHGPLRLLFRDVRRIELSLRVPDEVAKRLQAAIADLGHADFARREVASSILMAEGERALPALREAEKSHDAETARRAGQLLKQLKETIPATRLVGRPHDVLFTTDSKLAGKLATQTLRVRTLSFGEQTLAITDIRSLRAADLANVEQKALADPGNLSSFAGEPGKVYAFRVTGRVAGSTVWGTDMYTVDSPLALTAVHAGLLKPGETGVVQVSLLGPQPAFAGSARNGVTTLDYGPFNAYRIISADEEP
ncbi:MAG: LCCL domain-containing protein [Gemmataceae bacterium]